MNNIPTRPLLLVAESAQTSMSTAAAHSHPDETGGILIGVYLDGQPWVTRAIELHSDDRGRHHYRIPAGVTQPAVHQARTLDGRLGYLGDWHSHPADVGPSHTDLATLAFISLTRPRTPNPTLVIARRQGDRYLLDARRITALSPRTCEIRLTGDLPHPRHAEEP
ncbi:Mov34/MPN/PAD-1 family protein [Nocardioides sp. REDSEA-S30_B4]|jgi:proteasome lid subunit RPN8/RPN11|uniref:Mov34/MPN/PAD-1 family protein n=1 Tax=Nocardioides sp. REDSEA-S30_B4 TaxID=1811552 RepID=UPI000B211142|nr:Mov34/MPN/PAD-1 family protein [Nocardioides sp. REDSEA-S30_B4]